MVRAYVRPNGDHHVLPKSTESSSELVRSLGETSDLKRAFDLLLDAVLSLDGVDCGGVYLVSEGSIDLISTVGLSDRFVDLVSHYEPGDPSYEIAMSGHTTYASYDDLLSRDAAKCEEGLMAIAVLPIEYDGSVVACLNIASKTVDDFDSRIKVWIENVASQVGGILKRIDAERRLRQWETESERVLNALSDPMHSVDPDLVIRWINPAFVDWSAKLGVSTLSAGQHVRDAFPFLSDDVVDEYRSVFSTGESMNTEEWTRVGSRRYLTQTTKLPVLSSGSIERVLTIVRDVTPRRRAEEEEGIVANVLQTLSSPMSRESAIRDILVMLKEHASVEAVAIRLRDGDDFPYYEVDGIPDVFVEQERSICGEDGSLECLCGAVVERRDDVAPENFSEFGSFYAGNMSKLVTEIGDGVRSTCTKEGYESVLLIPLKFNGTTLGLLQFNDHRPDLFDVGDIKFLESVSRSIAIAVQRNISSEELEESERRYRLLAAELESSNEELMEYSHVVSHQLRSPLRSIKQLCEVMTESGLEDCRFLAKMVVKKASECSHLVEDILRYSEVGRSDVVLCPVRLGPLITSVFDDVKLSWTVSVKLPDSWPLVVGEPVLVRVIFQNLVENAVKFNESDPKVVEIGWSDGPDGTVDVYVMDNGIGIPDDWLERMWRPHERHGYYDGTGMGLAIVQRAATRLGIPIEVNSEVGEGSTFTLRFKMA